MIADDRGKTHEKKFGAPKLGSKLGFLPNYPYGGGVYLAEISVCQAFIKKLRIYGWLSYLLQQ